MSITQERKAELITEFGKNDQDSDLHQFRWPFCLSVFAT